MFVKEPGTYKLIWDNSFSWFTGKTLRYGLAVLRPLNQIDIERTVDFERIRSRLRTSISSEPKTEVQASSPRKSVHSLNNSINKKPKVDSSNLTIDKLAKESNISKLLSESLTKKVIIVIIMLIISDDLFNDDSRSCFTFLTTYIGNYRDLGEPINSDSIFWNRSLWDTDSLYPIINITIDNILIYTNSSLTDIDFQDNSVLLTLAALYFESDTKELVLELLEVMIEIVENVAKDPINAKNTKQIQENFKNTMSKLSNKKKKRKEIQVEKYEVKFIQSAIVRFSALLAIGFGEAGGEIIRENLSNNHDINPMLKGKNKEAIFYFFCDIRGFNKLNEILQEKTMIFVNEVADIVHTSVDRYGVAANKNIGDAFLLAWRLQESLSGKGNGNDVSVEQGKNGYRTTLSLTNTTTMADMVVLGFLKIIIRINKDR
jgi:hypothetical protein